MRIAAALGICVGVAVGVACRTFNPEHCLHLADDGDAWCASHHTGTPYCSPCEAESNGCVAEPPTLESCPLLDEDASASSSSSTSE